MTSQQLIPEWRENHPESTYFVAQGTKCGDCKKTLTASERWRNIVENEEQDGNATWCDECAADNAEQ